MMKQRRSGKNARRGPKASKGSEHPPDFRPTAVVRRKLRFRATAAGVSETISGLALGDLFCTTPTAITGAQLASHYRIRAVEIWGPMAADLVPVTVTIEWSGSSLGGLGQSIRHSDTSMGSATPAHVKTRPPQTTQASQWMVSTTNQAILTLSYPANAVIDLTYEAVLHDSATVTLVTGAVAGATVGATYVRALNSPVNNNLVPIGLSTI